MGGSSAKLDCKSKLALAATANSAGECSFKAAAAKWGTVTAPVATNHKQQSVLHEVFPPTLCGSHPREFSRGVGTNRLLRCRSFGV